MRARLVRPELCADPDLAKLADANALFYIKLWMWCDDEGYFDADPEAMGAALLPFKNPAARRKAIRSAMEALVALGKVELLSCERHGFVDSIPRYRFQGGRTSNHVQRVHDASCKVRRRFGASSANLVGNRPSDEVTAERETTLRGQETRGDKVPEHLKDAPWNARPIGRPK